jgi:hypothetical protein
MFPAPEWVWYIAVVPYFWFRAARLPMRGLSASSCGSSSCARRPKIPDAESLHRAQNRFCARRLGVHDRGDHHWRIEAGLACQLDRFHQIALNVLCQDVRAATDGPGDPFAAAFRGNCHAFLDARPLQVS